MAQAPGAKMLKIVGIIMVIFGGIGVITGLMAIFGAAAVAATWAAMGISIGVGGLVISGIVAFIASVFLLFAGIMGIKKGGDVEQAQTLKLYGIVLIALAVISTVVEIIVMPLFGPMSIVGLILSLVLPVLYIVGANKNIAAK